MKVLLVHPSPLMYSEIYLRLEPLGLERVAASLEAAGHEVRLLDLQIFSHADYYREVEEFRPGAIGFSLNYLANVPEVIDLAKETKRVRPEVFVFAGGHSGSFVAPEVLEHAEGTIDCMLRGEGEVSVPLLLEAIGTPSILTVPGSVTLDGVGAPPRKLDRLDDFTPARHLTRRRHKYFIGELDPCASIEFTRGCPWDCSFCSAWTFYGRSYRKVEAETAGEELASIREPNVFIVDDVAFVHPEDGHAIADQIEKRRIKKEYYIETRCDVLLRNPEVFHRWAKIGLRYMFLGLEALDEEALKLHRKRISPKENFRALDVARELGIVVAVNLIADPSWDEKRFEAVREWALSVPEIVHLTVATPYPGTEIWFTEARRLASQDYRLFDVQHAVLPTKLPLGKFYEELVKTQSVLNKKHLGLTALRHVFGKSVRLLAKGQTNFLRMLWKFAQVYNPERQLADHAKPVKYLLNRPPERVAKPSPSQLFIHAPGAAPRATARVGESGAP